MCMMYHLRTKKCLMKDEDNGAILIEFVGLRGKMYALRINSKKDTKSAKGVKSSANYNIR